jgi:hypothetical protein
MGYCGAGRGYTVWCYALWWELVEEEKGPRESFLVYNIVWAGVQKEASKLLAAAAHPASREDRICFTQGPKRLS